MFRSRLKLHVAWLFVLLAYSYSTNVHAFDLEDALSDSDLTDDIIDLDEPFYSTELEHAIDAREKKPINIDIVITEKTPIQPVMTKSPDVTSDDDEADDAAELEGASGAGSGSGMDQELEQAEQNLTTLNVDGAAGIILRSDPATTEKSNIQARPKSSTEFTERPMMTTPSSTKKAPTESVLKFKIQNTPSDLTATTNQQLTSSDDDGDDDDDDDEDIDERDDGAADHSFLDWAIREGGEDKVSYESTSLPVTPSAPTTTTTQVLNAEIKLIPDILQEAGAGDGSPCDTYSCMFGGKCKSDNDDVICVCPINCTGRSTEAVCGSDRLWYRNRCEMQLEACESQQNIVPSPSNSCKDLQDGNPMCPETNAKALWGNWSPWVSSGDVDIRFRSCDIDGNSLGKMVTCRGPRVEVRSCNVRPQGSCKMWNGTTSEKFSYRCDGIDVRDIKSAEMTFGTAANGGDFCRYSLYDLKRQKMMFSMFNLSQVVSKGHIRRWCSKEDAFLVSHTPLHVCKRHLQDICKSSRKCKGSKMVHRQRNLGDFSRSCWKDFILGNKIPSGMSDMRSTFTFLCQRFAPDSKWGKVFGHKRSYFGTVYDISRRIPVMSLIKVTEIGDDTWPKTDYMIERGLLDEPMTFSWLFKQERGISTLADSNKCSNDWDCVMGLQQALPVDYDMSGYRVAHLIWPELVGGDIAAKLSTFTLTNAAPMHPSLYTKWRQAVAGVRKYAIEQCKIPLGDDGQLTSKPVLYLASGTVPSSDPEKSIGNGVNVPFLFWMAACCVREDTTRAFTIYARNIGESPVIVAPVLQLESLLQDVYKVRPRDINLKIFPAANGMCGELTNDVSRAITL